MEMIIELSVFLLARKNLVAGNFGEGGFSGYVGCAGPGLGCHDVYLYIVLKGEGLAQSR